MRALCLTVDIFITLESICMILAHYNATLFWTQSLSIRSWSWCLGLVCWMSQSCLEPQRLTVISMPAKHVSTWQSQASRSRRDAR